MCIDLSYAAFREHVFGLSTNLYSGNQIHSTVDRVNGKPVLVYSSAAVGIIHDPASNRQCFLTGHTDDIVCISVSNDGGTVATGQIGKDPYINIWDVHSVTTSPKDENELYVCRSKVHDTTNTRHGGLLCTVGGANGYSPKFFQRGICAVELSPTGRYVVGIGCDDKHRLGIWDISHSCNLIVDTVVQNGLPPQIKGNYSMLNVVGRSIFLQSVHHTPMDVGIFWCPTPQQTSEYITREHCGNCELIVTIGKEIK